jgi:hypothetical protein
LLKASDATAVEARTVFEHVLELMDGLARMMEGAGDIDEGEIENGALVLFTEGENVFGGHRMRLRGSRRGEERIRGNHGDFYGI